MKARRIVSGAAALALVLSSVPAAAFAADEQETVWVAIANNTFTKGDGAAWDGVLVNAKEIPIDENTTMLSAITAALEAENYTINAPDTGYGPYISDINGVGETTYAVKENCYPGWNISLNQWFTNQGLSAYTVKDGTLKDGDFIGVEYAVTGADVRNVYYSNDTSLSDVYINGELFDEFKSDTFEYTVELDSNELVINGVQNNAVFQEWSYINNYTPEAAGTGYRPQDVLEVKDGDVVYLGVGNSNWPSSYFGSDTVTESVYKFNIVINDDAPVDEEVKAVEKLIEDIGVITLDNEPAIKAAQEAFDKLTKEQQDKVYNSAYLEYAVEEYQKLLEDKNKEQQANDEFDALINAVADRLAKEDAVLGNEWKAIGLAVNGKYTADQTEKLMSAIADYALSAKDGKLNDRRCTENAKEAITAAALGYDPTNIAGVDLLKPLADKDYVSKQGITGYIWANIAYTSVGKEAPYTKELLGFQLENGAFSYDGQTADIDTTAMVLTALRGQKEAEEAVTKGLNWLADALNKGSFKSSESLSQYLIALMSNFELYSFGDLQLDPSAELLKYYLGNGEFAHVAEGKFDSMATEQAFLALNAVKLYTGNDAPLYQFDSKSLKPYTAKKTDPSSDGDKKGSNPATAGGLAGGLLLVTVAGAAFVVSKKK